LSILAGRTATSHLYRTLLERHAGQTKHIRRGKELSAGDKENAMSLQQAITEFRGQFRGAVIEPEDAAYDAARKVYNGMIDRRPRLIAKCTAVADVMAAVLKNTYDFLRPEDRAAQEHCDGCGQSRPASGLVPIGDGSIKVCGACYAEATAMILTSGDICHSPKVR
jgi:hypothetical protein